MGLIIRWGVVPKEFLFGYIERASGDVVVSTVPLVIDPSINDWVLPVNLEKNKNLLNCGYLHNLCVGEYIIEPGTKWDASETSRKWHSPGRMYVEPGFRFYRVSDINDVLTKAITDACTKGTELYESSPARVAGAIAREIFVMCDELELKDE